MSSFHLLDEACDKKLGSEGKELDKELDSVGDIIL